MNKRVYRALHKTASAATDKMGEVIWSGPLGIIGNLKAAEDALKTRDQLQAIERLKELEGTSALADILPGVGSYRATTRKLETEKALGVDDEDAANRSGELVLSMLNPLNLVAAPGAALAAALTPKYTLEEALESYKGDQDTAGSFLIPGKALYKALKRYGASERISQSTESTKELAKQINAIRKKLEAKMAEKSRIRKQAAGPSLPPGVVAAPTIGMAAAIAAWHLSKDWSTPARVLTTLAAGAGGTAAGVAGASALHDYLMDKARQSV